MQWKQSLLHAHPVLNCLLLHYLLLRNVPARLITIVKFAADPWLSLSMMAQRMQKALMINATT